ncbi:MAG: hypothetical protein ACRDQA_17485 [Nocardioidaceae bacterium]
MRSNGLTAAAYTPVADLNPRVADAFLDELQAEGIAAYSKPAESSTTTGFDRPEFRVDVMDRLFVDSSAYDQVHEILATRGQLQENDDLTWAQIVAGFDQPVNTLVAPWPANEDVDDETDTDRGGREEPEAADDEPTTYSIESASTQKRRAPNADPDEERFVPPEPPPLPRLAPVDQLSWLGVIGGPLLLLISAMFTLALPTWLSLVAVAAFVGGFVSLVVRMRRDDGDDWSGDNGAQV